MWKETLDCQLPSGIDDQLFLDLHANNYLCHVQEETQIVCSLGSRLP